MTRFKVGDMIRYSPKSLNNKEKRLTPWATFKVLEVNVSAEGKNIDKSTMCYKLISETGVTSYKGVLWCDRVCQYLTEAEKVLFLKSKKEFQ